jgi:hypothetical protein
MTAGAEWTPDEDGELAEAAKRRPGWDFHRVYGGVLALPAGTPFAHAFTLRRLEEKVGELDGAAVQHSGNEGGEGS